MVVSIKLNRSGFGKDTLYTKRTVFSGCDGILEKPVYLFGEITCTCWRGGVAVKWLYMRWLVFKQALCT